MKITMYLKYKVLRKIIRYIALILSIFPVILIRILRPIILIRLIHLHSEIMGHFACQPAILISEKKIKKIKSLDLFYIDKVVANYFWLKKCKEKFIISSIFKYISITNSLIPFGEVHELKHPATRDLNGYLSSTEKHFKFSHRENQIAKEKIKSLGIHSNDKFICIVVRDSKYKKEINKERDFSYHDYRNSDIKKLKLAVNFLSNQGYKVIRMGKYISNENNIDDMKLIDYANSPQRSDFLDIWLFANCFFCITPGTGIDEISRIFKRPSICINHLPILDIVSYDYCTTIPKHLYKGDKKLNLNDHINHSYFNDKFYTKNKIKIKELSENEIFEEVKFFLRRLNGKEISSHEDIDIQNKFWQTLKKSSKYSSFHGIIHPEARISPHFVAANPDWLS